MFEVVSNEEIAPQLHRMVIARAARGACPQARPVRHRPRAAKGAERIPLTIADDDPAAGTITLIIQAVGRSAPRRSSRRRWAAPCATWPGRWASPPTSTTSARWSAWAAAWARPCSSRWPRRLAEAGNDLTTIIGGRSEKFVILRDELGAFSNELLCTTEDGSLRRDRLRHRAPQAPARRSGNGDRPQAVYAVGPVPMMKAVANLTREYGVKTIVSLNPIMVDGTGMCGGCRVTVGGEIKFACVDGPEFDGHQVDFDELAGRQAAYHELDEHGCRIAPELAGRSRPEPKSRSDHKERMAIEPRRHARAGRRRARPQLHRGQPGPHRRARRARSAALPPVQEQALHERLPGRGAHPRVPRAPSPPATSPARPRSCSPTTPCRRPPAASARRKCSARASACAARRASRSPSAGSSASSPTGPRAQPRVRRAAGHADRPQGRRRRRRPGRSHRRRRAGPHGPRRARLRGPARHRRRAALRHPRVPPAQGHRRRRGRQPAPPGRRDRVQRDHRPHAHRAGAHGRLRRRLRGQRRRPAHVPEHPRREPQGRLLGQRVPDARQPDGRLHELRRRHADRPRQARAGLRRRQRGHGRGAHRPAPGRRARPSAPTAARAPRCRPASRRSSTPSRRASTSSS